MVAGQDLLDGLGALGDDAEGHGEHGSDRGNSPLRTACWAARWRRSGRILSLSTSLTTAATLPLAMV